MNGIGVYFGSDFARPPILCHISSNGFTAPATALLTHFAAMNADHTNINAMISIIIVPKNDHMVPNILLSDDPAHAPELQPKTPANVVFIHPNSTMVFLPSGLDVMVLQGFPNIVNVVLLLG